MAETMIAVVVGFKLGVYIALLVYSFLIDTTSKKKGAYGISIFALALIGVASIEFFNVVSGGSIGEKEGYFQIVVDALNTVAGLGLLSFLNHISKNLKDYR